MPKVSEGKLGPIAGKSDLLLAGVTTAIRSEVSFLVKKRALNPMR